MRNFPLRVCTLGCVLVMGAASLASISDDVIFNMRRFPTYADVSKFSPAEREQICFRLKSEMSERPTSAPLLDQILLMRLGDSIATKEMVAAAFQELKDNGAPERFCNILLDSKPPSAIPELATYFALDDGESFHTHSTSDAMSKRGPPSIEMASLALEIIARNSAFSPVLVRWAKATLRGLDSVPPARTRQVMAEWAKANTDAFSRQVYEEVQPGEPLKPLIPPPPSTPSPVSTSTVSTGIGSPTSAPLPQRPTMAPAPVHESPNEHGAWMIYATVASTVALIAFLLIRFSRSRRST